MKGLTGKTAWKTATLGALIVFALAACGKQALVTTEKILAVTGRQFISTGATFNQMCAPGAIPRMDAKTCQDWKEFVPDFQAADKEARILWSALASCELAEADNPTGRDCGSRTEILSITLKVKNILADFAFKLLARQQLQHQGGAR